MNYFADIPTHWEKKKLKYLAQIVIGITYSPEETVEDGLGLLVLRSSNIQNGKLSMMDNVYIKQKNINERQIVKENDILLCSRNGSLDLIGKNILIDKSLEGNTFGAFMTIVRSQYWHYLYWFFNSQVFKTQSGLFSTSTVNQLTNDILSNLQTSFPPLPEQEKIANFLDEKTAQIDSLITKKTELIELLKEEEKAFINEIMLKGINNNHFKEYNIKWLKNIPSHWRLKKLKYNTYIKGRIGWHGLKADEFVDEGAFCVTGTDFKNGNITWNSCYKVEYERYEQDPYIQLKEDDLLITKDGTIGKIAIVKGLEGKATLNSGIFVVRPTNEDYTTKFLYWALKSCIFKDFIAYTQKGSTINHLYQEVFENMFLPLPPLFEQNQIVSEIETHTQKNRALAEKLEKEIILLKEYRQSLISEAVTGKVSI